MTFRRFMRHSIYGAELNHPGLLEIKYDSKKVFRGRLGEFCGTDTLFPVVPIQKESISIDPQPGEVKLVYMERASGLLFNSRMNISSFHLSLMSLRETHIENSVFLSSIFLDSKPIHFGAPETVVRGRSFRCKESFTG